MTMTKAEFEAFISEAFDDGGRAVLHVMADFISGLQAKMDGDDA
jgi:hypothetical protein